jgi:type I restriction enzyme S subunit
MVPKNWKEYSLEELFEFKNGINAGKESYGRGTKFINISEILKYNSLTASQIPGMVEVDENKKNLYSVKKGDILFNRTSEVAEEIALASVYLDDELVVFGGFVIRGRPLNKDISHNFSKYLFHGKKFRTQAVRKAQGAIRSNIGQGDLCKIRIDLPPLKEQEGIAKILSCWDEAIELQECILTNLRMLRNFILKTEVKKICADKNVKSYKISEVCSKVTSGGTPSTKNAEYWKGGEIPWMNSGEINLKFVSQVEGRITDLGLRNSSTKIIPANSVLVALAGQGRTRGTVAINKIPLCTNQSLAVLIPGSEINYLYLYYNLESRYQELRKVSTGEGGRGGLNLQILSNLKIPLPDLSVQKSLSESFYKIDESIDIYKKLKEHLEVQRKGLMQQLLTGKIRVKV